MTSEPPAGGMTDTVSTPKLLPCPWCGGAADLYNRAWGKCGDCGAKGPVGDTPEEAIRLWNTRAPDPLKEAVVAAAQIAYNTGDSCAEWRLWQAVGAFEASQRALATTTKGPDSGGSIDPAES